MVPRSMRAYTVVVCVLAAAAVVILAPQFPIEHWPEVIALVALTFVTENFAFQLPLAGSVSLSFAVTYAALLYAGPLAAIISAVAGSISLAEHRAKKPLTLRLFNVGQLSLSATAAGLMYVIAGGANLGGDEPGLRIALAAVVGAPIAFYAVNVVLVGYAASLLTGQNMVSVLRSQGFLSYAASLVVLTLLGLMVASLLAAGSVLGLLLLVLPFMAARRTFRVYAELSEAYTATVRSLVTAIEAKDPYTRGHSERVAVYATALAERLALPRSEIELLERAALLHDVGKIGIPIDTLSSPNALSADEVRLVRQHPSVGANLVSDVEFIADCVPIILHHHERVDGTGYPLGLVGSQAPKLSKILAIADAYDAMTSDRAYRLGMSQDEATAELRRVAGSQLDAEMAKTFIDMLDLEQDAASND